MGRRFDLRPAQLTADEVTAAYETLKTVLARGSQDTQLSLRSPQRQFSEIRSSVQHFPLERGQIYGATHGSA